MKRRQTVLALFLLLAGTAASSDRTLTIETGSTQAVRVPFEIGAGANSDPEIVGATLDLERKQVLFEGRKQGDASYTVIERREDGGEGRTLEVQIRVIASP